MFEIIWILIYLAFPALILYLCMRFPAVNKIGAVLLCYICGIIVGNTGILPEAFGSQLNTISEAAVALSLPLLLFSMNIKRWFTIAGKALLSMLGAIIAAVAVSTVLFAIFHGNSPDAWMLSGMSIGVYTGGTPNLAAIKTALGVDGNTYILFHTYDTVISLVYIIFMVSIASRVFGRLLPAFRVPEPKITGHSSVAVETGPEEESVTAYSGIFNRRVLPGLFIALCLSAAAVGAALIISGLFPAAFSSAITIILITSIAIVLSFIPRIRRIEKTFQAGMYVIYIFCFAVASMTDLNQLVTIDFTILAYVLLSIAGSIIVHAIFCRLFGIDTDTFIVTSVSAICSPPFVPVVAAALKNRQILLSGLTTGIIGYAAGNYLGISVAFFLRNFI